VVFVYSIQSFLGQAKASGNLTQCGDGAEARFYHPIGVFAERDGCILIADASNHGIRRLVPKWFEMWRHWLDRLNAFLWTEILSTIMLLDYARRVTWP
jgi:hypothetical protein